MQRVKAGFARIESAIGLSGLAAVSSGVVLAVCGTALAIHEGVSYPLAVMVGYCAAVGSACLGAALVNIRRRAPATASPVGASRDPSYAAWKLVSKFRISDASRLWCGIEPGSPHPRNPSLGEPPCWMRSSVVNYRHLQERLPPRGPQEQRNPGWSTEIGRDDLISWGKRTGIHRASFRNRKHARLASRPQSISVAFEPLAGP